MNIFFKWSEDCENVSLLKVFLISSRFSFGKEKLFNERMNQTFGCIHGTRNLPISELLLLVIPGKIHSPSELNAFLLVVTFEKCLKQR